MKKLGIRMSLAFILVAALTIGSAGTAMADKPVKTIEIVETGWASGDITFNYTWSGWGAWGVLVRAYCYNATDDKLIGAYSYERYSTPDLKRVTEFAGTGSIAYNDSGTYKWRLFVYLLKKNEGYVRQGGATAYAYTGLFTIVP